MRKKGENLSSFYSRETFEKWLQPVFFSIFFEYETYKRKVKVKEKILSCVRDKGKRKKVFIDEKGILHEPWKKVCPKMDKNVHEKFTEMNILVFILPTVIKSRNKEITIPQNLCYHFNLIEHRFIIQVTFIRDLWDNML